MIRHFLLALTLALTPTLLQAGDWPQFLGPTRDSVSAEKVAPWKEAPKVLWKQPLGEVHSSPVVANGVVYAFFKVAKKDAEALAAFDAVTGEKKWEKSYDRAPFKPQFGEGPRGTPAVSGGKVYTFGSTGVLTCWDAKAGDITWSVDTLKEFKAKNLLFGISTSPTVVGKNVVVMVGGKGAGVVAFDKDTGKMAWHATDDPASYASPLPTEDGLLFLTGNHVRSLSADGKEKWAVPFQDLLNESSTTPVVAAGLVVASSVTAGTIALKLPRETGASTLERAWKDGSLTCYFSTPVVVGPHLYMVTGSIVNPSIVLRCVETATGKVLWTKPKLGKYHAALIRTGDDKLLMLDDAGNLILVQPDAKEYKELARSKVCGETRAHPALSNGRVYVRDNKELVCVKLD